VNLYHYLVIIRETGRLANTCFVHRVHLIGGRMAYGVAVFLFAFTGWGW
jgi:hypothetical protein